MNILITNEELNNLKCRDNVPVQCSVCGKIFFRTKNRVLSDIKGKVKFVRCSNKCYVKTGKIVKCNFCGKEIYKTIRALKKSKTNYCSSKCCCAQGNKIRWKNHISLKEKCKCLICGKHRDYRSNLCQNCSNIE